MSEIKPMTQKDRSELRRILKARFELLHQQLRQRKQEVENSLEAKIRAEHEDAIKKAVKKTDAFRKKLQKIEDEARELTAEMKTLGIVPGQGRGYYSENFFSYSLETSWSPIDLQKKIQAAYKKIAEQAGLHTMDLNMQQLELEEELAIGALGSDEAKGFLTKIPNIDKLLPMNGNVTAALEPYEDEDYEDEETIVEAEV